MRLRLGRVLMGLRRIRKVVMVFIYFPPKYLALIHAIRWVFYWQVVPEALQTLMSQSSNHFVSQQ